LVGKIADAKLQRSFRKIQALLPARFLPPEDYYVVRVETGKEAAFGGGLAWFCWQFELSIANPVCYCMRTFGRRMVMRGVSVPYWNITYFNTKATTDLGLAACYHH